MSKKPRKIKLKSKNPTRRKNKGDLKSLKSEIGDNVSETLPPGHRFDYEISNVAFCMLVFAYITSQETGQSIEKILRKELTKKIRSRKMSKVASKHFASIIDLARETPLAVVVKKILEVTWDEYLIISKHMIKFESKSYKDRFDNFISKLKDSGWKVIKIDKGFKGALEEENNYLLIDNEYEKFFNKEGAITSSFHVGAKSNEDIHVMTESAYQSGLVVYRNEMKNKLYNLVFYPENNIPGVAFSPPSVTELSYEL